jgi:hypothetical protein
MSFSADHVLPIKDGGHNNGELRAAHLCHNQARNRKRKPVVRHGRQFVVIRIVDSASDRFRGNVCCHPCGRVSICPTDRMKGTTNEFDQRDRSAR